MEHGTEVIAGPPAYQGAAVAARVAWWRPTPLWVGLLVLALMAGGTAAGLLYVDDARWYRSDQVHVQQLAAQRDANALLRAANTDLGSSLAKSEADNESLRAELQHPTLTIWNVAQTIEGTSYLLEGGLPDTFTYHLRATSDGGPMNISLMTYDQFASGLDCVHGGRGSTNSCMTRQGRRHWVNVTSVDEDLHEAEGCAGYVLVWTTAGRITVRPNVSVTYNPADHGTC